MPNNAAVQVNQSINQSINQSKQYTDVQHATMQHTHGYRRNNMHMEKYNQQ